jgi:hypothetical protein
MQDIRLDIRNPALTLAGYPANPVFVASLILLEFIILVIFRITLQPLKSLGSHIRQHTVIF